LRVCQPGILQTILGFAGVDLLGKHPVVSTYHMTGHFQAKTKRDTNLRKTAIIAKAAHK